MEMRFNMKIRFVLLLGMLSRIQHCSSQFYTGYPGYWVYDEPYGTRYVGPQGVIEDFNDPVSIATEPCRYDGTLCLMSKDVLSDPGQFEHNTGRTVCEERLHVPTCTERMIANGFTSRLDPLRSKLLYPVTDGHTASVLVSGANFYGELGVGTRAALRSPSLHRYWKLGDERYEQTIGAGRGFKNLSLVHFGFEHGFGLDAQGVFYAWGNNEYGQLGLQSKDFPSGHRYHALWPEPVPFFRPNHYYICEGAGPTFLDDCDGPADATTCFGVEGACRPGRNQVAMRRNAFAASKEPLFTAHSAVVTEFLPAGCFEYARFLDDATLQEPASRCTAGGRLWVWGFNMNAELGTGSTDPEHIQLPRELTVTGDKWYAVATGGHHTIASTVSGKVYSWGLNNAGQLGLNHAYMDRHCAGPDAIGVCCGGLCRRPQLVTGACTGLHDDCLVRRRVVHVAAGQSFSALLDSEGIVWLFGSNRYGQLCQGRRVERFGSPPVASFDDQYAPRRANLPADVRIVDLVAGFYHVVAASFEGEVFAWGRNDRGQLGRGHTQDDSCHLEVKTELPAPLNVTCGSASVNGSAVRKRLRLCNVLAGNSTMISAGELHSGAITRANHTRRTREYRYGTNSGERQYYSPEKVVNDCTGPFREDCIEQGKLFRWPSTMATIYMWGDNRYGQSGYSLQQDHSPTPRPLTNLMSYDWSSVFAGSRQTFWVSRVNHCPGNCNGHGICDHDTGRCTCEYPWTYELDCLTAWCPNNCTTQGDCYPLQDVGDTGLADGLRGRGPECVCAYPHWDIDCSRAQCPNNCWGPDHGICNNTDGTCVCVGNATVTYTGFDCYVPDPLHVLDPLRFYTQHLLRLSPFFQDGPIVNLTQTQIDLLDLYARFGAGGRVAPAWWSIAAAALAVLAVGRMRAGE
mmetsp:Transcript_25025/g.59613  ORF Transcript_25025/g.59613 Transcript_25025/m.59613 type:complete len:910 (+) Transcript_25025:141-2870(+)